MRHISILSMRNVIWTLWVGGGGGDRRLWRFSVKIMENFENFNILKSSIQSVQNPTFSWVYPVQSPAELYIVEISIFAVEMSVISGEN